MTSTMTLPAVRSQHGLGPSRPAMGGTVRLTRRGRWVVLLVSLAVALAIGVALSGGSVATQEPGTPAPTQTLVVRSGQTLWDIAAARADDGDVRGMIAEIQQLNGLHSGMVTAGQRLVVPAS